MTSLASLIPPENACNLMGTAGLALQMILGFVAFLTLIYKRCQEKPQRAWKIWFLDVSKQGIGNVILHFLNLLTAFLLTDEGSDTCSWYFVTIVFDTVIGVTICCLLLSLLDWQLEKRECEVHTKKFSLCFTIIFIKKLKSGNYFKEEHAGMDETDGKEILTLDYGAWFLQLILWIIIVLIVNFFLDKALNLYVQSKSLQFLAQIELHRPLSEGASGLFKKLDDKPTVKLIIVILITPVLCTAIQFWVVDNFIKKHKFNKKEFQLLRGSSFFTHFGDNELSEMEEGMSEISTKKERPKVHIDIEQKFEDEEEEEDVEEVDEE